MKKYFPALVISLVFLFSKHGFSQSGQWVWMKGDSVFNTWGEFGIKGIPDSANTPPGLQFPCVWVDHSGNFWIFGGIDYHTGNEYVNNAFWRYMPYDNTWVFMGGNTGIGHYGTKGIPDSSNIPPPKNSAITWVDTAGDFWLYGGEWETYIGNYCDMWKYSIATNEWTWVSGSQALDKPPHYGSLEVFDSSNTPGSRKSACTWIDKENHFWLYGGYKYKSGDIFYDDLWQYDPQIKQWAWMAGSNKKNDTGNYSIQGIPDSSVYPRSRSSCACWQNDSSFYLFGGNSNSSYEDYGNDLWLYNLNSKLWTWVNGSKNLDTQGVSGIECQYSLENRPTTRAFSSYTTDSTGNFYLIGGQVYDGGPITTATIDVWVFNPSQNQWKKIRGDTMGTTGFYGIQGVYQAANEPRGRLGGVSWTDMQGNIRLFGGGRITNYAGNDLWIFLADTLCTGIPTSSSLINNTEEATLSPNPAHNNFQLTLPSSTNKNSTLTIYNLLGEKMVDQKLFGETEIQIDISKFVAGVYVVEINSAMGHWVAKLIKE